MIVVDTSVVFRLFEKGERTGEAKELFDREEIFIPCEVLIELSYLLRRSGLRKGEVIANIESILLRSNVKTDCEPAFLLWKTLPLDKLADAVILWKALERGYRLVTYDERQAKMFERLISQGW